MFSCVRNNTSGSLGFLSDARRVNVSLTRARRGLIVVGNAQTLENEPRTWARWLCWARAAGVVVGEVSSGVYDVAAVRGASAALMASFVPGISDVHDGLKLIPPLHVLHIHARTYSRVCAQLHACALLCVRASYVGVLCMNARAWLHVCTPFACVCILCFMLGGQPV